MKPLRFVDISKHRKVTVDSGKHSDDQKIVFGEFIR